MNGTTQKWWGLVALSMPMVALAEPRLERGDVEEPLITVEHPDRGSASRRVLPVEGVELVLMYGGEQGGDPRTCGCLENPRGSLSRTAVYARAVQQAYPDALLLNVGAFLADTLGADGGLEVAAIEGNSLMLQGLGNWDVLNITARDLPFLAAVGHMPEASVSANLSGPIELAKVRKFTIDGRQVNVTGVSGPRGALPLPEGWSWTEPAEAVSELIATEPEATWVVLAWGVGRDVGKLAELSGVSVLIDGNNYAQHFDGVSKDGTLWLRSRWQTQALGEVRLAFEGQQVVGAQERVIELDRSIGEDGVLKGVQKRFEKQQRANTQAAAAR